MSVSKSAVLFPRAALVVRTVQFDPESVDLSIEIAASLSVLAVVVVIKICV